MVLPPYPTHKTFTFVPLSEISNNKRQRKKQAFAKPIDKAQGVIQPFNSGLLEQE